MTGPVATAYVAIVPTTRGLTSDLTRGLVPAAVVAASRAGTSSGQTFVQKFRSVATDTVKLALSQATSRASGTNAGQAAGQGFSSGFQGGTGRVGSIIKTVLAAGAAAGAGLATAGLKGAAALEQTQVAFTSLLGSSDAAQQQIVALQKFAANTPFSQKDVLGYAQQFYAVADSIGFAKDQVIPFTTAIGDVAAVTGASTENIHNAVMAIGQIGSSGKVTLENLNQISEAFPGFNGAAAIASATGQTTAQVLKQITAGTLDAKTGVQALIAGMQKFPGAAGAMAKQSQTLNGLFSTFTDTVQIQLTQAFQPLVPTVKKSLADLTPVVQSSLSSVAPQITSALAAVGPGLVTALTNAAQAIIPIIGVISHAVETFGPPLLRITNQVSALMAPIIKGLASIASGVISGLGPIVNIFSHVAVAIVPFYVGLRIANGVLRAMTVALGIANRAMALLGLSGTRVGTALRAVQGSLVAVRAAALIAGVGLGLLVLAWQQNAQEAAEAKARAEEYFQALQQSKGLIDDQIRQLTVQKLATEGVYDAAKKYGLSLDDVTKAALGNEDAFKRLVGAADGNTDAILDVIVKVRQQNVALQTAQRQYQQTTDQLGGLTTAAAGAATQLGKLAGLKMDQLPSEVGRIADGLFELGGIDLEGMIAQLGSAADRAIELANSLGQAAGAAFGLTNLGAANAIGVVGLGDGDIIKHPDKGSKSKASGPSFDAGTLSGFLQQATGSQTNPLTSALNAIFDSAKAAGKKLSDGLIASLRGQNQQLIGLTRQRDKVAEDLQQAQQKLADLRSEVSNVRSTTLGTFDITNVSTLYKEPVTFGGIMRQIRKAVANASRFKSLLQKLTREGLAPALIQQLAEAGPGALAEAKALASATPKQIGALNRQYKVLGRAGAGLGNIAADQMFAGGVQAAQGLVNGLRSKESALNNAIRDLARSMVATLKSTLGIHSPSRVARGLGAFFGDGIALGIADRHADVAAEADRLARAAASASAPFANGGSYGAARFGGGSVHITQNNYHPIAVPTAPVSAARMRAATTGLGR